LFQEQELSFLARRFFFEQQELLLFLFFLSLFFFSNNTKTLYTRLCNIMILKSIEYLEQPQAQMWANVLGGSRDDQL
jgi:hypothetical protein